MENYKKNAGEQFSGELDVLVADMRSSSYEAALTRFEARLNSPMLSDVVRGAHRGAAGEMTEPCISRCSPMTSSSWSCSG